LALRVRRWETAGSGPGPGRAPEHGAQLLGLGLSPNRHCSLLVLGSSALLVRCAAHNKLRGLQLGAGSSSKARLAFLLAATPPITFTKAGPGCSRRARFSGQVLGAEAAGPAFATVVAQGMPQPTVARLTRSLIRKRARTVHALSIRGPP
jgi:hypothetical protein